MKILYTTLATGFCLLLVLSIGSSYYRFFVSEDYKIRTQVPCDPAVESCFIQSCDPAIEGDCTGNPEEDISYYKIAFRSAKHITCSSAEECDFACTPGEPNCGEIQCLTTPEGEESCYTEVNP